jgi:membrane-associated protein
MLEAAYDLWEFVQTLDQRLADVIAAQGAWVYLYLWLIIFLETGVFFMAVLPGDTLLLAAGVLAGGGLLNVHLLYGLLTLATMAGDSGNYWLGRLAARPIVARGWLKPEQLARAERFFDRYGARTILFSRYLPVIRAAAPFVAGASRMGYPRFVGLNALACASYIAVWIYGAYGFGRIPFVRSNLGAIILLVALVVLVPVAISTWRSIHGRRQQRRSERKQAELEPADGATG